MTERLRRIGKAVALALPLAFGWTIYTAQPTPGNFLLGYLFSIVGILATGMRGDSLKIRNAFLQVYNLLAYILYMAKEILVAGLNVARIVLSPNMPIKPGISIINTGDEAEDELISAISAHGITITPGELVVDFQETRDVGVLMIVHSLNTDESESNLERDQQMRLKRIKGILGHD
ncbi:MAG: Na+/H+ antiporter subunit E [Chloroflexi bacterium]|nr:Na+/H+ antiporter subunit E [Chloroflexota bacterium]